MRKQWRKIGIFERQAIAQMTYGRIVRQIDSK
jgi:hypothetical protein